MKGQIANRVDTVGIFQHVKKNLAITDLFGLGKGIGTSTAPQTFVRLGIHFYRISAGSWTKRYSGVDVSVLANLNASKSRRGGGGRVIYARSSSSSSSSSHKKLRSPLAKPTPKPTWHIRYHRSLHTPNRPVSPQSHPSLPRHPRFLNLHTTPAVSHIYTPTPAISHVYTPHTPSPQNLQIPKSQRIIRREPIVEAYHATAPSVG